MSVERKSILVESGSELHHVLNAINDDPIELIHAGRRYVLSRQDESDDFWAGYDPEKVRQTLDETVGLWSDVDADALIADIYEARIRGSRHMPIP